VLAFVAALVPSLVAAPAHADAAQQFVIPFSNSPTAFSIQDPCRGGTLNAVGAESGVTRVTELGANGFHMRVNVWGQVQLLAGGAFVGTWSYRLSFVDQFPPDGQGASTQIAAGPLVYADGSRSIVMALEHVTFGQGDVIKREIFQTACGG
jgi:hypothetical protein